MIFEQLGTDVRSDWSFNSDGDINLVTGEDNLAQALVNRLRADVTTFIFYDRYGGNLFEHFGDMNNSNIHEYIRIEIESICRQDPRVKQIEATVNKIDSETVSVSLNLLTISKNEIIKLNLIVSVTEGISIIEKEEMN